MGKYRPVPFAVALALAEADRMRPRSVRWAVPVQESAPAAEVDSAEKVDHDQLKNYWLHGKGQAKWVGHPHPWTALYRHLKKHMPDEMAKRVTSQWYFEKFGHHPGQKRKDKNAVDGDQLTETRVAVREATTGGATVAAPGRLLVRLIRAGWSQNGNLYSAEVLRAAARDRRYPKGILCYADHASEAEEDAYPSGSVKNLAGVLETDARWDEGEQALMAEVRLFAPWRESILDMAESIGMSIRAWVTGDHGQRDGREGFIVEQIVGGRSVDFVTVPAAGGGIVSILEAVGNTVPTAEARNAGHWFEARIHAGFTEVADSMFGDGYLTREERITLSGGIGDALAAFAARVEADAPHLYERDPYQGPDAAPEPEMADEAVAVDTATPENVTDGEPPADTTHPLEEEPAMSGTQTGSPPAQAGTATVPGDGQPPATTVTPTIETAPALVAPQVDAAQAATATALTALTEQLASMQQQLATVTARADQRDAEHRTVRNEHTARAAVTAAVNGPDVPAQWRTQIAPRVTTAVLAAVPTGESGDVDTAKLGEAVKAAVETELGHCRAIQAQTLEEAGIGLPTGLGATRETVDDGLDSELKALFENTLGLNSKAADIAVKGRG